MVGGLRPPSLSGVLRVFVWGGSGSLDAVVRSGPRVHSLSRDGDPQWCFIESAALVVLEDVALMLGLQV